MVRAEGAFTPIVDRDALARPRAIIDARSERLSDSALLELLATIFAAKGMLTGLIIDEAIHLANQMGSVQRENLDI